MARRQAPDITVIGHTDLVGPDPSNDALSLQRAERVKSILAGMGIPPERILTAGRGRREPLVPAATGVSEPRNRGAEIRVREVRSSAAPRASARQRLRHRRPI